MLKRFLLAVFAVMSAVAAVPPLLADEKLATSVGKFAFVPLAEDQVPPTFQLKPRADIEFRRSPLITASANFTIAEITFPSPVVTPHVNNNTVHCEYFCPVGTHKRPGVIVLHILGETLIWPGCFVVR